MLPSLVRFPARPPRHAHFGIRSIDPMHLLSTLQTPRYRDARKTRCWSVCSTLTRPDFHRQADTSFPNAHRTRLLPCVMTANITDEDGCTTRAGGIIAGSSDASGPTSPGLSGCVATTRG